MIKAKKKVAEVLAVFMAASSTLFCFVGCESPNAGNSEMLNKLADDMALALMSTDPFAWNAFSKDPEGSFGITRGRDNTWYSYSGLADDYDVLIMRLMFNGYYNDYKMFREDRFTGVDAVTYRSLGYMFDTYCNYYNSKYAKDFMIFGGSYISAEGGYVADFASSFENFIFRDETDVKILLEVTQDTQRAFGTYRQYVSDRISCGYPLYDYTITAMQSYLDDISEQGDEYYLYEVANEKIDAAEFLTDEQKESYKTRYDRALTDNFMKGVKSLSTGLNSYTGSVANIDTGYLASYGAAGKAYYEWLVRSRTGISNADVSDIYDELEEACEEFAAKVKQIDASVAAIETTEPDVYNNYTAYLSGEKVMLDLSEPTDILDYLKDVAKYIVPELETTPEIDFKYMDETVAGISSAVAYYMKSPVDEIGAAEHITLNPIQAEENPQDLLTTIAHEGYPGHLYAHVRAKETGTKLISTVNSCLSFGEGWAQYVELALLDHIASTTDDKALKLYAERNKYYLLYAYINNVLTDISVNYYGVSVGDMVLNGVPISTATNIVGYFMENAAAYIPYGYGMYYIYELHNDAKDALGDNYDEIKFNAALLSEGFGPTLERAKQITKDYIAEN